MRRSRLLLIIILFIAAFLRFYNLNWGNGHYFHPDENNMANAVSQMRIEDGLNPHFFAYGQLPLYLAYGSYQLGSISSQLAQIQIYFDTAQPLTLFRPVPFPAAIMLLRMWSALFSVGIVFLAFLIVRRITRSSTLGLIAAILVSFVPGMIQSAHFGTTESMLSFFFLLLIYLSFLLLARQQYRTLLLIGVVMGLALATKLSAVFFTTPPLFAFLFSIRKRAAANSFSLFVKVLGKLILLAVTTVAFFLLASPHNLIHFSDFINTNRYETQVATGEVRVFYTGQFTETTPLIFQLTKIFPFSLGLPLLTLGIFSSMYLLYLLISKKVPYLTRQQYLILIVSFAFYFLPNSYLYTKWARFMTPLLPLISIWVAVAGYHLLQHSMKETPLMTKVLVGCIVLLSVVPGIHFFTLYTQEDTRVAASTWIYRTIPDGAYILSETANVVDIPVVEQTPKEERVQKSYRVISFNFYDLETNPALVEELIEHLDQSDYIFVPSRRIFANRMRLPQQFPLTTRYYQALFSETHELGFSLEKSISNCSHSIFRLCDEGAEETWTVFDHPVIRVYKKIAAFDKDYYRTILTVD